jgi:hypothetical protein
MNGHLNYLIALEQQRDLQRNVVRRRAAIVSSPQTGKRPAVLAAQRIGSRLLLRRLRTA